MKFNKKQLKEMINKKKILSNILLFESQIISNGDI